MARVISPTGARDKSSLEMPEVLTDRHFLMMRGRFAHFTRILLVTAFVAGLAPAVMARSFELTPEQRARVQKFLPHTFPKLMNREPVHAITLGDSVMDMYVFDDNAGNVLRTYAGLFLDELGAQFYYTGGVRRVNGRKDDTKKLLDVAGPEILLYSGARGGKLMIHGIQSLMAGVEDQVPDIVLVSFGINDANFGLDLTIYRKALEEIVATAKAKGSDVLLFGPSVVMTDPPEAGMALTRPYASVMKDVADANGLFYCDLGDISSLVQVDERYAFLLKPLPKKKSATDDAATKTEEQPRKPDEKTEPKSTDGEAAKAEPKADVPSPIVIPRPPQVDPDAEKRAARVFAEVVSNLRLWFTHGATFDTLHPNTAAHRLFGRRVYDEFIGGPQPTAWEITGGTATLEGSGHCSVAFRLENTSDQNLRVVPLPLVTRGWKPLEAQPEIELKPGKRATLSIAYQQSGTANAFAADEPWLRFPVLLIGSGTARIDVVKATLQPLAMQWNAEARFNQSGSSKVGGTLVNTTKNPVTGKWQAAWLGQQFSGSFNIPAGGSAPVELDLKLPSNDDPISRRKGTLSFAVTSGAMTQSFDREIEIARNIGLKEAVALHAPGQYALNKAPAAAADTGVTFRADADDKAFYLTWDLRGLALHDNPDDGNAFYAEVSIDARTYGKRLAFGSTDAIRVVSPAADGDAKVLGYHPWSFGTGYSKMQDLKALQAKFSSRQDGTRRLTLMIPRSFFYLHEWAMSNGNSQLGINCSFSQWMPGDNGAAGTFSNWTYTECSRHRDDAQALDVLELTDQPTKRWTVRLE